MIQQTEDPRDDFLRAQRLYRAYQEATAAGKPFTPDPADVEAFKRTRNRYQSFKTKPTEGESSEVPAEREEEFRSWAQRNQITDLDNPESHYDYRGAFLSGVNRGEDAHWPDTFKQHGHPTFSVESRYSKGSDDGGRWEGDKFVPSTTEPPSRFERFRRGFNEFDKEIELGVTDAFTNAAEGIGKLTGWKGLSEGAAAERKRLEEADDPDHDSNRFLSGRTLGRIVGEGATTVAGGGLITKGLSKIPATARLAQRILALQGTRAAAGASGLQKAGAIATRAAGQVLPIAPIDLAIGAGQAEEGESPLLRGAEEIGYDLGGSALFEAAGRGLRARRLTKLKAERAARDAALTPSGGRTLEERLNRVGEPAPLVERSAAALPQEGVEIELASIPNGGPLPDGQVVRQATAEPIPKRLPKVEPSASDPVEPPPVAGPSDINPATSFVAGASSRHLDQITKEMDDVSRRLQRAAGANNLDQVGHYTARLDVLRQEAEEATAAGRIADGTKTPPPTPPEARPVPKVPRPAPSGGRQLSPVERAVEGAQQQQELAAREAQRRVEMQQAMEGVPTGTASRIEANTGTTDAAYAVLPLDRVVASNVPSELGPFTVHPLHPGNERTYSPGSDQHMGVLKQAGEWNPRRVLNTDPTAMGGPPVVVPWTQELADATGKAWEEVQGRFWVAGGNSRVMAQQLVRSRGRGAVIDAANRQAAEQFGLPPGAMADGQVVVRVATQPVTTKEQAHKLVSQLNEPPTKALAVEEAAVSAGSKLSPKTRDWFGGIYDADKTLRANLQDHPVARELRDRLSDDGVIDASNRAKFFHPDGALTEEGKTFVERMMLGRAVPDPAVLRSAAPSMVAKIEAVATLIDRTEVGGESFDLRPHLTEILRRQGGSPLSLRNHLAQLDMLEEPPGEQVQALWNMMDELPTKELREKLGRYAEIIEKRVVRTNTPDQTGFGLEDPTPIPTAKEAWESAFVAMPERPTFTTRGGGVHLGSLVGGLQGMDPGIAEYLVRGTIGGAAAIGAADPQIDPRLRATLTAVAVIAGGPALNKALAKTGLHPGEALYRAMTKGGASTLDAVFRRLSAWKGEAEAYKVMQFVSYQYGMPEWVSRALVAREVGIENETGRVMGWVNREIVQKLQPAEREQVTSLVRQVEQRRQRITSEIDRLQSLRHDLRDGGPGALAQSKLWHPTDPTDDAGLLGELQKARALREAETAQAWTDIESHPLAKTARKLVDLEDQLADRLVAEGYDARIFERFRGAHLTRAFEKYLDPEQVPAGLSDALQGPGSAGAVRDPAFWSVARQDLDAVTRAKLGEINDAAVLFAKGQSDKLHSIFTQRYFTQLEQGYAKDGLPVIAGKARPQYLQLPNNPALGDLAGKWAHPSVGHSLLATYNPTPHGSAVMKAARRWYRKGLGAWKSGKTAWSPMTQSRNFMSNAVLLHLSGVDLFDPRNNKLFFEVLSDYHRGGKLWREAQDAGVFRGTFRKAEVEDLYRAWSGTGEGTPLARLTAMAGVSPTWKRLLDKPGDWYQAQEQFFKLVKYAHVKKGGGSATEAADQALRTLFDYGAVPDWVRMYRSSIFGSPFFTFTYKAVPRIVEWTAKNPDKVASLVAVFAAVEALSDKEPLPQVAPELVHPWLRPIIKHAPSLLGKPGVPFSGRQALQLPFRGEKGQALASLDFLLPTGAAMPDAPTAESKLWDAIPPALRPGNPAATLPFELLKNRALYSDRPIRPDAAARDGTLRNILKYYGPYIARQLGPGAASLIADYRPGEGVVPGVAVSAAKGDIPLSGLAAHLAGTKPVYMDPRRSAMIEMQKLDKEATEVGADRRRELARQKATVEGLTDEDRAEIRARSKGRRGKIRADSKAVREALRRAREAGY